jgi:hypothetical protein
MHIKLWQQHCNVYIPKKPYTLAGFEPGIFCSVGGRDDHYATPPGPAFYTYFDTLEKNNTAVRCRFFKHEFAPRGEFFPLGWTWPLDVNFVS